MRHAIAALAVLMASPSMAAWFTDNGDREALSVLRAVPEETLSDLQRELLTASNRIGWLEIAGCGWASNAVLVNVDGQDYAVTSLHLLTGKAPNDVHCEPDLGAVYMPNASYIMPDEDGGYDDLYTFSREQVAAEPNPLNFTRSGAAMPWVGDWVAYRLTENVSDQVMPEGSWGAGKPRGAMEWSSRQNPSGPVWVIGYDGRYGDENGWQFSWQECRQAKLRGEVGHLYFTCDISPGASSSLIAVMEAGRLTFQGIVTASMEPVTGDDVPLPGYALLWNIGTTTEQIREKLDPEAHKEAIARAKEETGAWGRLLPSWGQ